MSYTERLSNAFTGLYSQFVYGTIHHRSRIFPAQATFTLKRQWPFFACYLLVASQGVESFLHFRLGMSRVWFRGALDIKGLSLHECGHEKRALLRPDTRYTSVREAQCTARRSRKQTSIEYHTCQSQSTPHDVGPHFCQLIVVFNTAGYVMAVYLRQKNYFQLENFFGSFVKKIDRCWRKSKT
jgi:hypothetical protein